MENRTLGSQPVRNVGLYMRVSGRKQEREETVETQYFCLSEFCERYELTVVGDYRDTNCENIIPLEHRKDGQRLLADAAAGLFDTVLIYDLERLSRVRRVQDDARALLAHHGVQVISMENPYLNLEQPEDRLQYGIRMEFAAFHRDKIVSNAANGRRRRAREGGHLGGIEPFGYRVEGGRRTAILIPDEEPLDQRELEGKPLTEALVVRLIYHWGSDCNWSDCRIARELNLLGIPSPCLWRSRGRSHMRVVAGRWNDSTIGAIIRNPLYKGQRYWGKHRRVNVAPASKKLESVASEYWIAQQVPALVSEETWQRAQAQRSERAKVASRGAQMNFLLTGLICCGLCQERTQKSNAYIGHSGVNQTGKRYGYYTCGGRHSPRRYLGLDQPPCPAPSFPKDRLESDVWEQLVWHVEHQDETVARIQTQWGEGNEEIDVLNQQWNDFRRVQIAAEEAKSRIPGLLIRGAITEEEAMQERATLDTEIGQLSVRLREIDQAREQVGQRHERLTSARSLMDELKDRLDQPFTDAEKKHYLHRFVDSIWVNPGEDKPDVQVVFCFSAPGTTTACRYGSRCILVVSLAQHR